MDHYAIIVYWSDEDALWIAAAHGATPEEAVAELRVAMEGWLEAARANNFPIPEPRYQPRVEAAE